MHVTAVVVGPCGVRASGVLATEQAGLAAAALDAIDDELALVDERPVAVGGLWREVFAALLDGGKAVLVCPSWWSDRRIATVSDAAHAVVADVEVARRSAMLVSAVARQSAVVVEIAGDFVALSRPPADRPVKIVSRDASPADVADEVVRWVASAAVVDRAAGVGGAVELGAMITDRLRASGTPVTVVDDERLLRAAQKFAADDPTVPCEAIRPRRPRVWPWVGAAAAAGVTITGIALASGPSPTPPTTLLVEGRVVVEVPVTWTARRITGGPGSARLQVTSPTDPHAAVHVTQSLVPSGETLQRTADALRRAMRDEPPGVFVDFNPADRNGDREVVTYREIRDGHDIRWTVLLDGQVRISVGCQSARGAEESVRPVCEVAIASARAVAESVGTVAPQRQSNNT